MALQVILTMTTVAVAAQVLASVSAGRLAQADRLAARRGAYKVAPKGRK